MIIIDALKLAKTEYVVYFLLTAYVETVGHRGAASRVLPKEARRMPVRDADDVARRLRVLRTKRGAFKARRDVKAIDEAVSAFGAAFERLRALGARLSPPRMRESIRYSLIGPLRALFRPPLIRFSRPLL
jgi:hypothetical protein